jgi:hypothetical protein
MLRSGAERKADHVLGLVVEHYGIAPYPAVEHLTLSPELDARGEGRVTFSRPVRALSWSESASLN